jgi:hypothetical protein
MGVLLEESGVPVALVDLDWLGWVHLGPSFEGVDRLIARNLAAIWPNLAAAGARRLILVRALRDRTALDELRAVLPEADLTVVRLTAADATLQARLRGRDAGGILEEHLEESRAMASVMDAARLEDFQIQNEGKPVREVAQTILRTAGWT